MTLFGEVFLRDRRHVEPELVAQREDSTRTERAVNLPHGLPRFVPEVEDMRGHDEVDRRELAEGFHTALDQGQPAGTRLFGISSSGLGEHLRREIDAPHPRRRQSCQQLMKPDARAGSELDGPLHAAGHLRRDLTDEPPVEAAGAPDHAPPAASPYHPAWPAELACEN